MFTQISLKSTRISHGDSIRKSPYIYMSHNIQKGYDHLVLLDYSSLLFSANHLMYTSKLLTNIYYTESIIFSELIQILNLYKHEFTFP